MSSFHFRLETLLRLRLADRDQRRAELAKAQRAEDTLLAQADALSRERAATQELSRKLAAPGTADVDRLIASHRYELVLRTKAQQTAGQIEQVRAEVERRRQILVEADREVRVLEKLREKQLATHNLHKDKREQTQLDEGALVGFTRREAPI